LRKGLSSVLVRYPCDRSRVDVRRPFERGQMATFRNHYESRACNPRRNFFGELRRRHPIAVTQ
jgi:hypothetical protein